MTLKTLFIPVIALTLVLSACTQQPEAPQAELDLEGQTLENTEVQTNTQGTTMDQATELKTEDTVVGTGEEAVEGKQVTVHYTGTLTNGSKFDSSKDRGTPFTFTLGAGEVIQGWDQGVKGMKVGGTRKLTIPAELGYGARAIGTIPANSTLLFDVELLKVE